MLSAPDWGCVEAGEEDERATSSVGAGAHGAAAGPAPHLGCRSLDAGCRGGGSDAGRAQHGAGFVAGALLTSWACMVYVTSLIRTYPVTLGEWGSRSPGRCSPVGSSAGRLWTTSRWSITTSITSRSAHGLCWRSRPRSSVSGASGRRTVTGTPRWMVRGRAPDPCDRSCGRRASRRHRVEPVLMLWAQVRHSSRRTGPSLTASRGPGRCCWGRVAASVQQR